MGRCFFFAVFLCLSSIHYQGLAQLYVNGGSIYLDSGSALNIKGDLLSVQNIAGSGKVIMNGTTGQQLDMGGYTVPGLEIDNPQHVTLASNLKIQNQLNFVNGRMITGNNDVTLSSNVSCNGMGTSKLIDVSGGGSVYKEVSANISYHEIPVGSSTGYNPIFITTNSSSYQNAKIGVRVLSGKYPDLPAGSTDYLKLYWPVTISGITGNVSVVGQYNNNTTELVGSRTNLRGTNFDGSLWSSVGETHDATTNRVGMPFTGTGGTLTAINQGGLLNLKAFIQGYYIGSNAMQATLHDLELNSISNATDSLSVDLWSPSNLTNGSPNYHFNTLLHHNGMSAINLPASTLGNSYYLALKHRNALETWSANPLLVSNNVNYDFTTGADKAYSDGINVPMKQLPDGKFAFYSGDVNQDGTIDASDMLPAENDASTFAFGYNGSDCTGDGVTDLSDMVHIENNAGFFIFYARPY